MARDFAVFKASDGIKAIDISDFRNPSLIDAIVQEATGSHSYVRWDRISADNLEEAILKAVGQD